MRSVRDTKRVTVTVPDDVAAYLDNAGNASATVVAAVRAHMERTVATAAILKAMGYRLDEEGRARWREKLRPMSVEQRVRIALRYEQLMTDPWRDLG
jgi:hypothetical protein